MPPHIDCDGPETMAREPVGYRPPCPSGLSATVREDYRESEFRAIDRRCDFMARFPGKRDRLINHSTTILYHILQ